MNNRLPVGTLLEILPGESNGITEPFFCIITGYEDSNDYRKSGIEWYYVDSGTFCIKYEYLFNEWVAKKEIIVHES